MTNVWGDGYTNYPNLISTHCIHVPEHPISTYNYYVSIKNKIRGGRERWPNRSLHQLSSLQEHQIEQPFAKKSTFIRTKNQLSDMYQLGHSGVQHQAGSWGPQFQVLVLGRHFWTCSGSEGSSMPWRESPKPGSIYHKLTEEPLGFKEILMVAWQYSPWACGDGGHGGKDPLSVERGGKSGQDCIKWVEGQLSCSATEHQVEF